MGIAPETASLLMQFCKTHAVTGRVLTLGKQDVSCSEERFNRLLAQNGLLERCGNGAFRYPPETLARLNALKARNRYLSLKSEMRAKGHISDIALFQAMGFDEARSVDISTFEGADYAFDLNNEGLGAVTGNDYQLVFDGGTMEHVFDTRQVLANVFSATAVGGYVVHLGPSNNTVDHGFYQFSPTLYYDYYTANNFEILSCKFIRYTKNYDTDPYFIHEYYPGSLDPMAFGGLDDQMYFTLFFARKTAESTCGRIPQQGHALTRYWR